ncbi:MAG: hypothetical protein MR480_06155, partial [Eubacterium coprostanoligenes]|nr:hypothetical protein [Eubacterium coprostanoligenes]
MKKSNQKEKRQVTDHLPKINKNKKVYFKQSRLSACRKSIFDTLKAVEKVSEFRFLANFAVRWYRLFAKNEKRQKCCKFDTYSIFKTPPST